MMCSLRDGDVVEVFVKHLVDEAIVEPMLIENDSHVDMGESGSAFNTRPTESENFNFGVGEGHLNSEDHFATLLTSPPFITTPHFNTGEGATTDFVGDDDIDVGPTGPDFSEEEVEDSDYSTEDCVEFEAELVGDDEEEEYGSDVHEEVRELRAKKRSFQRRKRRERVLANNEEVPVGEAGPDLGFDETETGKTSHEGRLGGDEPYFASSDKDSFELDEDECCDDDEHESGRAKMVKLSRKRRTTIEKIIHDPTAKKVVWQLGMLFNDVKEFREAVTKYAIRRRVQVEKWVNEPKKVRVRCKDGCPWLLYGCLDKTTNNFMIKTYNPKHTCNKTTRNYLCNAKILSEAFRERITEQPNIRVFKLQEMIRKKFKLYVSKTTVRRARAKVLKDIMDDHVVEFGRILDYKDELLRTNPGTSCVVKVGEPDAEGVCKGQLLVVVANDGNNQMMPLAWAVVEKENKNTWTMFVKCIRSDLGLGDGGGLTLITYMQKVMSAAITYVLPKYEHRMCARHILANWTKDLRGLQRRQ
ncbi:hypothetical protein KY290_008119 [Solanum tuberosum]|uniref:Transposase MuDR plant domain-containing protein n=1 Tax=Solanum tuberosum TaxID=4113 RepID=A0ABQ7W7I3_SOLTU|nr:hypothetical protein KY290_008119 [Solanum tuberosum]